MATALFGEVAAQCCDQVGIVWVLGLRLAERVRVGAETESILKIRLTQTRKGAEKNFKDASKRLNSERAKS